MWNKTPWQDPECVTVVSFLFFFFLRHSPRPAASLPQAPLLSKQTEELEGRWREGESPWVRAENHHGAQWSPMRQRYGFLSVWTADTGPLLSPACMPGNPGWILIQGSKRGLLREDFSTTNRWTFSNDPTLSSRNTSEKFLLYFLLLLIFFPSESESRMIYKLSMCWGGRGGKVSKEIIPFRVLYWEILWPCKP